MFVPEGVLHLAGFSNNFCEFCKEEEFEKILTYITTCKPTHLKAA